MMLPNYASPPRHVGDGFWRGVDVLAHESWYGALRGGKKAFKCAAHEGLYGCGKGAILGSYEVARGVTDGTLDFVSNMVEGLRNSPDTLIDACVGVNRPHNAYFVDEEDGRVLETRLLEQPSNVFQGSFDGTMALTRGVTHGLIDLVSKPIDKPMQDANFAKGVARGLRDSVVGLTTKSTSGVLDFADAAACGLRNTPHWLSDELMDVQGVPRLGPPSLSFRHTGAGHRYWDTVHQPGSHPGVAQLAAQPGGWQPGDPHPTPGTGAPAMGLEPFQGPGALHSAETYRGSETRRWSEPASGSGNSQALTGPLSSAASQQSAEEEADAADTVPLQAVRAPQSTDGTVRVTMPSTHCLTFPDDLHHIGSHSAGHGGGFGAAGFTVEPTPWAFAHKVPEVPPPGERLPAGPAEQWRTPDIVDSYVRGRGSPRRWA